MSESSQELIGVAVGSFFTLSALFWFGRNAFDGGAWAIAYGKTIGALIVFALAFEAVGRLIA